MTSDPSQVLNHCCAVLPWCSHNIIIPLGHGISRLLRSLHFLHHLSPMAFDGVNCMRPTPQYSVHNIHALKYHDYYPHCDNYTAISTNYTGNNHTINVTEGQNISISCQIHCPNVDISGFDIVEDWVLIDPQTYKLYYIINSNDADTFTSAFGISMTYSHSNSQPLCPTNGEQPKPFSVTLHNFNASLKELLVICGIRRIQCLSSSHAISLFARLKLDTSPTTESPTSPTTQVSSPITSTTESISPTTPTTQANTPMTFLPTASIAKSARWDEASIPYAVITTVIAAILVVIITVCAVINKKLCNKQKQIHVGC